MLFLVEKWRSEIENKQIDILKIFYQELLWSAFLVKASVFSTYEYVILFLSNDSWTVIARLFIAFIVYKTENFS